MKLMAIATALLLSANVYSQTTLVKGFDGKSAVCRDMIDVGSRAYGLEIVSEKITGNEREVKLEVSFFKCAEVPSGYGLRESSPTEILSSFIVLPDGKIGQTKNKLVSLNFAAYDDNEKILTTTLSKDFSTGKYFVYVTLDKNVKKAFIGATFVSNITSPIGNLEGAFQRGGGYVLKF